MIIAENEEGDLPHLKAAALVNAYSVASDVVVKEVGLLEVNFAECVFEHCDFSMTNLANTTLREVEFKDCKLLGTRFEDCNAFLLKMGFRDCQMNLSSFNQLQLKQTVFGLLSIFLLTLITIEFVGQNFRLPM
ncbi:MAG: pentapeptide repeat-containing protein [Chitinophagales bacterium]